MKKTTVAELLNKSEVNEILDEINKANIQDLAVVYRTKQGKVERLWIGDSLALLTLSAILVKDINMEIECWDNGDEVKGV